MAFKKGVSANPGGRPHGRNRLTTAFWEDFAKAWDKHGRASMEHTATNEPATFLRVAASLMPKETEVTLRKVMARELTDAELDDIIARSGAGEAGTAPDKSVLN